MAMDKAQGKRNRKTTGISQEEEEDALPLPPTQQGKIHYLINR